MTSASPVNTVERPWTLHVERPSPEVACVELAGSWRNTDLLPDPGAVFREIEGGPPVRHLTFDTSRVIEWDSGLVTLERGAAPRDLHRSSPRSKSGRSSR